MELSGKNQQECWNRRFKAVALGIVLALTALTVRHWYETTLFGHPICANCRPDFPQFYAAAKLIWQSPSALYDEASQLAIQKTIDSRIGDSLLPYTYPPFTAMVFMPLGWLSFPVAFAAMALFNLVLFVFSLRLLISRLQLTPEQSIWLILIGLSNFGVHSALLQGQASFVILTLMAIFAFSFQETHHFKAGLSTGLMFFKPQLQLAPFIILFTRRRWLALAIASITVTALAAFSVILVGWAAIHQYLILLQTYLVAERGHGSYPEAMHNLRALAQYAVPFSWSRYLWVALLLLVIAATFILNAQQRTSPKMTAVQWIGNFVAGVLIAPHLYPHDLAILIIPAAFSLKMFQEAVPLWLIFVMIAVGVYPVLPLAFGEHMPPLVPLTLLVIFFQCVLLSYREERLAAAR
jgi:Glycosyltransferase family 87